MVLDWVVFKWCWIGWCLDGAGLGGLCADGKVMILCKTFSRCEARLAELIPAVARAQTDICLAL